MDEEYSRVEVYCVFDFLFGCLERDCERCEVLSTEGKTCAFWSTRQYLIVKGKDGYLGLRRACDPKYAIAIIIVVVVVVAAFLIFAFCNKKPSKKKEDNSNTYGGEEGMEI